MAVWAWMKKTWWVKSKILVGYAKSAGLSLFFFIPFIQNSQKILHWIAVGQRNQVRQDAEKILPCSPLPLVIHPLPVLLHFSLSAAGNRPYLFPKKRKQKTLLLWLSANISLPLLLHFLYMCRHPKSAMSFLQILVFKSQKSLKVNCDRLCSSENKKIFILYTKGTHVSSIDGSVEWRN